MMKFQIDLVPAEVTPGIRIVQLWDRETDAITHVIVKPAGPQASPLDRVAERIVAAFAEVSEDVHEEAYDLADGFSDIYGCDHTIRERLTQAFETAIQDERDRCATIAQMFIINKNSIHPDVPFESMSETSRNIAHMTCQHIADAIDPPPADEEPANDQG